MRSRWIAMVGGALIVLDVGWAYAQRCRCPTCIYIVQGLPSRTVSVTVDGETLVDALAGGKVAGPFRSSVVPGP
jgi:hypothetical protein